MAAGDFNHFPQIPDILHKALSDVVKKTAFDIQAGAASSAPVDTGFLRNSIYTVTSDYRFSSGFRSSSKGGDQALPQLAAPGDDLTALIAVGAAYGIYVEFGTRFMPAQPYFYPAVEAARSGFMAAISRVESRIQESLS